MGLHTAAEVFSVSSGQVCPGARHLIPEKQSDFLEKALRGRILFQQDMVIALKHHKLGAGNPSRHLASGLQARAADLLSQRPLASYRSNFRWAYAARLKRAIGCRQWKFAIDRDEAAMA
jgi:hypothetical protein